MINHIATSANGSHPAHIRQDRCGMVLVVVLVVISVLSLADASVGEEVLDKEEKQAIVVSSIN